MCVYYSIIIIPENKKNRIQKQTHRKPHNVYTSIYTQYISSLSLRLYGIFGGPGKVSLVRPLSDSFMTQTLLRRLHFWGKQAPKIFPLHPHFPQKMSYGEKSCIMLPMRQDCPPVPPPPPPPPRVNIMVPPLHLKLSLGKSRHWTSGGASGVFNLQYFAKWLF